jgi:hypothetical protein
MKQANIILASKEVLGTLRRTAAARIKADGTDCSHLMHEIGATDEDNYDEQLKKAMSIVDVIPMPTDIQTPNFKELCLVSQQSIKTVADLRKTETELFDHLAEKLGTSNVLLSEKSEWTKANGRHTFIELLAFYRNQVLAINPSNIQAIKKIVSTYDEGVSFEENAANLMVGIAALQPHDVTTSYQKLELLKAMIKGQETLLSAFNHYTQATTKFSKQTVKDAIKYIAREVSSNPADFGNSSNINNVISEELMEVNSRLIQNQVHQEAMINQLMATVNAMSASTPHKSTTKYCHLHGPNNSHNGTECKKMGSPGFTILGKAITQAMINNRVPGKVVDGVTGKK